MVKDYNVSIDDNGAAFLVVINNGTSDVWLLARSLRLAMRGVISNGCMRLSNKNL